MRNMKQLIISDKVQKEKEQEYSNQIISALTKDYTTILLCDLKQDTFEVVKGIPLYTMTLKKSNS